MPHGDPTEVNPKLFSGPSPHREYRQFDKSSIICSFSPLNFHSPALSSFLIVSNGHKILKADMYDSNWASERREAVIVMANFPPCTGN